MENSTEVQTIEKEKGQEQDEKVFSKTQKSGLVDKRRNVASKIQVDIKIVIYSLILFSHIK